MLAPLFLLVAVTGGALASPQYYGLPPPVASRTIPTQNFQLLSTAPAALNDFTSQTGRFYTPSSQTQTFQNYQFSSPTFQRTQNFQPSSSFQPIPTQFTNPNIQSTFNPAFQRTQLADFTSKSIPFGRVPVRSGIENHPFLHGNTLELLPPLQHVVGTKFPRVKAGPGYRFPTAQLLNTTPPPNLL